MPSFFKSYNWDFYIYLLSPTEPGHEELACFWIRGTLASQSVAFINIETKDFGGTKTHLGYFLKHPGKNVCMFYIYIYIYKFIDGLRKAGDAPGHKIVVAVCVCVFVVVIVFIPSRCSCCCCCRCRC